MFVSHPFTTSLGVQMAGLPEPVRREIEDTFRDYAALLKVAERDRQAVLGFVDNLDARLDDLPSDPDAARAVAACIAQRVRQDAEREGRGS
jgi:hypothetical protein